MEMAIALALRLIGTVSMINVFTGPVERKRRKMAAAKRLMQTGALPAAKAARDRGAARNIEPLMTQA
jgi:hypothetical protein